MRSTLAQRIASHDPESVALKDGAALKVTYGDLLSFVQATVTRLHSRDITGLAICCDNSIAHVVLDIACLEAGVWTLQIPPFFTAEQTDHALWETGCRHLVTEQPTGHRLSARDDSESLIVADRTLSLSTIAGSELPAKVLTGTAKVTFTSGSTAQPRGLCLSAEDLRAPVKALATVLAPQQLSQHFTILPQSVLLETVAGIYTSLYLGACCTIPSLRSSSGADIGKSLLAGLQSSGAHTAILVPELLQQLVAACVQYKTYPAEMRFLAVGGSRISDGLLQRAQGVGLPVYEGYGLSEAGSVVSLNLPGACRPGTVGRLLPHQQVSISGNGEIVLREAGFLGYCGEPVSRTNDRRCDFKTGDSGFVDSDGYLVVNGRIKDILITSMGRNVSPEWVESALLDHPGIEQALVYGDGQAALSALIVSTESTDLIQQSVCAANHRLPVYARVSQWCRVSRFTVEQGLLTANGKPRRQAILDSCQANMQYAPNPV